MWTVVYIAPSRTIAESLQDVLSSEGLLVMLREIGISHVGDSNAVEIVVPESEVDEAMEILKCLFVFFVGAERDEVQKPYMLKELFRKPKYVTVHADTGRKDIPEGLWLKCPTCNEILYSKELEKTLKTCGKCGYHFRIGAWERINFTVDEGSFAELDEGLTAANPLGFKDYPDKVAQAQEKTNLKEAIVTGIAAIDSKQVIIAVMDANFIMGSMGSVVGEKVTRAVEKAVELKIPLIIFATSGGARMQEGIIALMQMAKTCSALTRLDEAGLLYISVLTDPTTGGVTASFASVGDIVLADWIYRSAGHGTDH